MRFLDNAVVLQAYATCDEDRHIRDLVNLTLVGENYKIKAIRYLVKDVTRPLEDYVCFEEYDDDFFAHPMPYARRRTVRGYSKRN